MPSLYIGCTRDMGSQYHKHGKLVPAQTNLKHEYISIFITSKVKLIPRRGELFQIGKVPGDISSNDESSQELLELFWF